MNSVFVIIVSYNGSKWYEKCFHSLMNSDILLNVVVIDNASTHKPTDLIQTKFNTFHIIELSENLGFAKANNIGIKYALENGADYVFLLNQDAWIEPDTIGRLLHSFKNQNNVGIVSPIHMNGAGNALDKNFSFYMPFDFISDAYLNRLKSEYLTKTVNAAAWLVSAECLRKVGGFDTLLFMHYGEDDNYCQRIEYHGFKLIINTQARIHHDRENRGEESEYRDAIWKEINADLHEKVNLGNINDINVNMDNLIKILQSKYIKNLFFLRIKKVKYIKQKIRLYNQIDKSRKINMNDRGQI